MSNSLLLASIVGPFYLVFGLSMLLYVKQWQKMMKEFASNHFLMLPTMFISLIVGLIMINIHNIWEWDLYLIITINGWASLVKGVFYLLAPSAMIKGLLKCKCYQSDGFLYFTAFLMSILGVLLSYYAYLA